MKKFTLLILLSVSNTLFALKPVPVLWTFNVQGKVDSAPTVSPDGQTIYVGSEDQHLWALNANGTEKWTYPFLSPVYASPAVSKDGSVIYVSNNANNQGALYAINENGSFVWKMMLLSTCLGGIVEIAGTPKVDFTTGNIFISTAMIINTPWYLESVAKIDPSTGKQLWRSSIAYPYTIGVLKNDVEKISLSEITPDENGGAIGVPEYSLAQPAYTTTWVRDIYYPGASDDYWEIARWSSTPLVPLASYPTLDAVQHLVYVGDSNGTLYVFPINETSQSVAPTWTVPLGGDLSQSPPVIAANGNIYEGSSNGYLYVLNPDLTEQWAVKISGGEINHRVAVNPKTGMVYATDSAGTVYAIEPTQGNVVWSTASLNIGADTAPVVGANGNVYVGTSDGLVYAFAG